MSMKQYEFMHGARMLIENAANTPEINGALAAYGYTQARFKEGLYLLEAEDALVRKKSVEYGQLREASHEFSGAGDKANASYVKALKIARIALGDDAQSIASLKLSGVRKQSFAGWYDQAGTFYENMLGEKRFLDKLACFGYSAKTLENERAGVVETMRRYRLSAKATGEARASTAAKNKKLAELDDWVSDLRAVCEVAFSESKGELEKLGPLAPIRKPRRKIRNN